MCRVAMCDALAVGPREALQRTYRPLLARVYNPPLRPPLSLLYRGNRVTCPVCDGDFRKFVPRIQPAGPNRSGARCPRCGAHERHRHLWLFLASRPELVERRLRVLHFAPEGGISRRLRDRPNLDYVASDLLAAPPAVQADITRLPFADGSVDVIICSHVLEHVPDDRRALRELRRVLRPEGWAVLLVPIDLQRAVTFEDPTILQPRHRERAFGKVDHVRVYGRDFPERLASASFDVHDESQQTRLGPEQARRYGLKRHDQIFLATPRL